MKRGEISAEQLVKIVALVSAFLVLLVIVWPAIKTVIFGTGESGQCSFSLLISSLTKKSVVRAFGEIPAECKMTRLTIGMSTLQPYLSLAKTQVDKLPAAPDGTSYYPKTDFGYTKWALDKVISDQVLACYDRAERGSQTIVEGLYNSFPTRIPSPNDFSCVACSRISLDQDVQNALKGAPSGTTFSIWPWLLNNQVQGKFYSDYLTDRQPSDYYKYWLFVTSTYPIDKPFTVSFVAKSTFPSTGQKVVNIGKFLISPLGYFFGTTLGLVSTGTQIVGAPGIYPYDTLTSNLFSGISQDKIDPLMLVKPSSTPGPRCANIIGD